MFIPLSTDRPPKRRPVVNEALVVINMLVFLAGVMGAYFEWMQPGAIAAAGHYDPRNPAVWQLITYQFIHADIWHILFNMIFLWVFGNAVEGRIGSVGYLGFYLIAGCVAGIVHGMFEPNPVIGASGAVAGVSGGFLALFPRARIKVLFFFFFIGIILIPAAWLILLYFAIDVANALFGFLGRSESNVAVMAHIGGYIYGFTLCFALLALRVLKHEEFDIFYLFKQRQRRKSFARTVNKSPGMWDQAKPDSPERAAKKKPKPFTEVERKYAEERAEISRLLAQHEIAEAANKYRDLLKKEPEAVMPEPRQLDLANQLYADGDLDTAVQAYELLLKTYPTCRDAIQVKLILGLIYTRQSPNPERAKTLLEEVKPRLGEESERALADDLLKELA